MTFANASSPCEVSGAPHVAPALAQRTSTRGVCLVTSATRWRTPARVERSAGMAMAMAPGARLGRALRTVQAERQAAGLREEMKTLEAPAWRRLGIGG